MAFLENVRQQFAPKPKATTNPTTPKARRATIIAGVVVGITLVIYGGVFLYGQYVSNQVSSADSDIAAKKSQITQLTKKNTEAQSFADRLTNLKGILNEHTFWSAMVGQVTAALPKTVQFENFSADTQSAKMTMTARTNTFTSVAKTIVALKSLKDVVKDVNLGNFSYNPRDVASGAPVRFSLSVTLNSAAVTTPPALATPAATTDTAPSNQTNAAVGQ